MNPLPRLPVLLAFLCLVAAGPAARAASPVPKAPPPVAPVAFTFEVNPEGGNPFARDLWADVVEPSGRLLRLPAYYAGSGRFCVHARPDETGVYRFVGPSEGATSDSARPLTGQLVSSPTVDVGTALALPQVEIDPRDPTSFALSDGKPFWPIGTNLAWGHGDVTRYYDTALADYAAAGLDWMRVWMAYWDGMNLEWLPKTLGASPEIGRLDPAVAARWDDVIGHAQSDGVYLQLVLQHHGPYSSTVDSNWADNPFNAANPGGFLKTPAEFFTNPRALELTQRKFRYIVARWSWSTAIMAWELFNEVHWTDAYRNPATRPTVAAWHTRMAAFIRSVDVYHHLVTTSTEDLQSPIYAALDYYQPHCYPPNILATIRSLPPRAALKPVFYGETGDDHIPAPEAVKESGLLLAPPVWASLMGESRYPAQEWKGWQLISTGRIGELGAVARFLNATRLPARTGLRPDVATFEQTPKVPLVLTGGQYWRQTPETVIDVPTDGRMPADLAEIPTVFADHSHAAATGYPGKIGFRVNYPHAATLTVHVDGIGAKGAALRLLVDGASVASRTWPAGTAPAKGSTDSVNASIPGGRHLIELVNDGGEDWFSIASIDLGVDVPVLAAVGKRGPEFLTYWLWNRDGIFSLQDVPASKGILLIRNVPAGRWSVVWWDTLRGIPSKPVTVVHPGGDLRLGTPPISRDAAVVITRATP